MLWKAMAFGGHGAGTYRRDSRELTGLLVLGRPYF